MEEVTPFGTCMLLEEVWHGPEDGEEECNSHVIIRNRQSCILQVFPTVLGILGGQAFSQADF